MLFIWFCLCWIFVPHGLFSWCGEQVSLQLQCTAFHFSYYHSGCRAWAPGCPSSAVVMLRLSCSTGMWDLPGSGIESVSPASAGRFFTAKPPWKPDTAILK